MSALADWAELHIAKIIDGGGLTGNQSGVRLPRMLTPGLVKLA
jgi:phage gp29-like protein